jgi:hypothetical protein
MKMLTKAIEKKLPLLYGTEGVPTDEKPIIVKFFTPWSNWTWFMTEYDPEKRIFFGFVHSGLGPDCDEWGYTSLDELESLKGPFGLKVERDLHFGFNHKAGEFTGRMEKAA